MVSRHFRCFMGNWNKTLFENFFVKLATLASGFFPALNFFVNSIAMIQTSIRHSLRPTTTLRASILAKFSWNRFTNGTDFQVRWTQILAQTASLFWLAQPHFSANFGNDLGSKWPHVSISFREITTHKRSPLRRYQSLWTGKCGFFVRSWLFQPHFFGAPLGDFWLPLKQFPLKHTEQSFDRFFVKSPDFFGKKLWLNGPLKLTQISLEMAVLAQIHRQGGVHLVFSWPLFVLDEIYVKLGSTASNLDGFGEFFTSNRSMIETAN